MSNKFRVYTRLLIGSLFLAPAVQASQVLDDYLLQESRSKHKNMGNTQAQTKSMPKKAWTFGVYMAARNDLHPFSKINMRQMLEVGSSDYLNIVVNWDEPGKKGIQRFYVEKNSPEIAFQDPKAQSNSGDPQNLVDFCTWMINTYPADNYALIMWDHGLGGSIDPFMPRYIETAELFGYGSMPSMYDVSKGIENLTEADFENMPNRAVCFDDAYKSYINNQGLAYALATIDQQVLHGKKWGVIGFDACLCADLGMVDIVMDYAEYMVASEDVEPGTGANYRLMLTPLSKGPMDSRSFAAHMAQSYEQAYYYLSSDYTQSALDMQVAPLVEQNLHEISLLLIESLEAQKGRTVRDAIAVSCKTCTAFDDPNYKDLGHLYSNLLQNLRLFQFNDDATGQALKNTLAQKLTDGLLLIDQAVVSNNVGKNYKQARGISIYCPVARIHSSFPKTTFALGNEQRPGNAWLPFIRAYLQPTV